MTSKSSSRDDIDHAGQITLTGVMTDSSGRDTAVVSDAAARDEARVDAAQRLAASDDRDAWDVLFSLSNDHDLPRTLALAVGSSLARMAHRIRESGHYIRGEDENFLLRDFSEAAFEGYDDTAAELEREHPRGPLKRFAWPALRPVGVKLGVNASRDARAARPTIARFCTPACGGGGIRTHGELAPSAVFKTAAFDRSATPPEQ